MTERPQALSVSGLKRGVLFWAASITFATTGLIGILLNLADWQWIIAVYLWAFLLFSLLFAARYSTRTGFYFGCGGGKLHLGRRTILLSQMESISLDTVEKNSSYGISVSVSTGQNVVDYEFEFAKGYGTEGEILKILAVVSRDWQGCQKDLFEDEEFMTSLSSC